jgi:putative PIN family toxin of toxin-antitoxin system
MEVMPDTNVLFSAIFFPSGHMNALFSTLTENHGIVLCSYSLEELVRVTRRKFPQKLSAIEIFLQKLPYRLNYTPTTDLMKNNFNLRDPADYPILLSAILADADVLITGDHDFDDVQLDRPDIMTPAAFMKRYSA